MTLEFSEAEKYMVSQKKRISDLEMVYKNLKIRNAETVENQKTYANKIVLLEEELIKEN